MRICAKCFCFLADGFYKFLLWVFEEDGDERISFKGLGKKKQFY